MVRLDGVEPTSDAYKASALPLSYRRNYYIIRYKKLIISKFIDDLKADVQPTKWASHNSAAWAINSSGELRNTFTGTFGNASLTVAFGPGKQYPLILYDIREITPVEQATGIGPAYLPWQGNVLPLNYACNAH